MRRGYELNNPLICRTTDVHRGELPARDSFARLAPDHLALTSIKKAEDSDAWIVQWYDARGRGGPAILTLPKTISRAMISNALEEEGTTVVPDGNRVTVPTRPHGIVTLKVYF